MMLHLKASQRQWIDGEYTYPTLFGSVLLEKKNFFAPWKVVSIYGFCYEPGDVFDWCEIKKNSQYIIDKSGFKFKIDTMEVIDEN